MQVIARVVRRQQPLRMRRVARHLVEVHHRIEVSRRANPAVDRLPVRLALRSRMVVIRSRIRRNRRADYPDARRVRPLHDLRIRTQNALHQRRMFRVAHLALPRQPTQVIHSFEHNQVPHPRLRQHIAIETRQRIRPQPIGQQMIPADALIEHAQHPRHSRRAR